MTNVHFALYIIRVIARLLTSTTSLALAPYTFNLTTLEAVLHGPVVPVPSSYTLSEQSCDLYANTFDVECHAYQGQLLWGNIVSVGVVSRDGRTHEV